MAPLPPKPAESPKRILFIHPDLGIGGAERLVVDAAVGLQDRGHEVTIYTSHCDPRHCFDEARNGTLKVRVAGNSLFPPNILGRFSILCAILRQLHLTLHLLLTSELQNYDYIFVDQLSACIPFLRLFSPTTRILFYCHFPDYLLASRTSVIKSLYRIPFDYLEALTTGLAHTIVVNSAFTKSVFRTAFPHIATTPHVVYPCVDTAPPRPRSGGTIEPDPQLAHDGRRILLSINRFERKKNIALAIRSFALLSPQERSATRLVLAGGYDSRVVENVAYHAELEALCESLGLKTATSKNIISSLSVPEETDVLFLLSIPASLKTYLLKTAALLLYTPDREHFGIVPLEAMLAGIPVLAVNSGGPLETVEDGVTGWLRPQEEAAWVEVIKTALFGMEEGELAEMGRQGRGRVVSEFSKERMAERLEGEFEGIGKVRGVSLWPWMLLGLVGVVVGVVAASAV
ncbi:uncharacterized protein H6S33_002551 [Morchella sextelata]|uniref:uncharacterized protein n=1 Tax=Morchella sextelata TaxID=1174677 RepID=UPI001D054D81|nr:uncharacterized protein H6S33_002551 [Morchella sextelata]KAH0607517.1 hypothetical protein H6S33_002551 [Morchella sextelata]